MPNVDFNLEKINKQLVTFCALALLFLGSLFYFVSVAFKNGDYLSSKSQANSEAYAEAMR